MQLEERKATLMSRLGELTDRLTQIETELESHASADWEDMAQERETDEVLERLGTSGQDEIRMIQAALERIESGEYGYCARCGAEISAERLDVVPFSPLCRSCASRVAQ